MKRLATIIAVCGLYGCRTGTRRYVPLFERDISFLTTRHSETDSHAYMIQAWRLLRENADLAVIRAQLDMAYSLDPGYYEPIWGWGIFRYVQASRTSSDKIAAECLKDSVRYLYLARNMKSFPSEEYSNIDMDVANSLNALGVCFFKLGKVAEAEDSLVRAGDVLKSITPAADDQKARHLQLQAYNRYYRGDCCAARKSVQLAVKYGAQFPDDFLRNISTKEAGEK